MVSGRKLHEVSPVKAVTESPRIRGLTIGLITVDVILLGIYMAFYAAHFFGVDSGPARFLLWDGWYGDLDHSVLEIVGYVKMVVAAGLAFLLGRRSGQRIYFAWSAVFLLIFLDDALMLHEGTGILITELTGAWIVLGLRARDVGQLIFWLIVTTLMAMWLLKAHAAASAPVRRDSVILFTGTAIIASFSIGLDFVHALVDTHISRIGNEVLHYFEAAGEMAGMTCIVIACAIILARRQAH